MARRGGRLRRILLILVLGILVVVVVRWLSSPEARTLFGKDWVAVVYLEGAILDGSETVEALDKVAEDESIRGVVLRIDSPGGGVAPAQEIYDAVLRVREKKPIVASLGSLAASGGYYVASACHKVVANAGTLTGSIGVIMHFGNYEDLLQKIGVTGFVLKAGRFKDIGSPLRPMKEVERDLLDELLRNVHEQFIDAVAKGRGIGIDEIREVADGRLFSGEQALENGLVDRLGGLRDAVELAGREAGIEGEPRRIELRPDEAPWWWSQLFGWWERATFRGAWGLGFLYAGPPAEL